MKDLSWLLLPNSSRIRCDFGQERIPFWAKTTIVEQESRTFFESQVAAATVTDHAPVHVRNDMTERDIILMHQSGCELRGAINRSGGIAAPIHTHFDPD